MKSMVRLHPSRLPNTGACEASEAALKPTGNRRFPRLENSWKFTLKFAACKQGQKGRYMPFSRGALTLMTMRFALCSLFTPLV